MTLPYLKINGTTITRYCSLSLSVDPVQILNKALDGTVYLQHIGVTAPKYEVIAWVDEAGRGSLLNAYNNATPIEVTVTAGVFTGRITDMKFNKKIPGPMYRAVMDVYDSEMP